jgi:hypothetical protein
MRSADQQDTDQPDFFMAVIERVRGFFAIQLFPQILHPPVWWIFTFKKIVDFLIFSQLISD